MDTPERFCYHFKKGDNYAETMLPPLYMYLKSLEKMGVLLKREASRWLKLLLLLEVLLDLFKTFHIHNGHY